MFWAWGEYTLREKLRNAVLEGERDPAEREGQGHNKHAPFDALTDALHFH